MKIMAAFFFLFPLVFCLILQPSQIAGQAAYKPKSSTTNPKLIEQACQHATDKNFCISTISSDKADGPKSSLKDLAFIAFKLADKSAAETATYIKSIANDDKIPAMMQEALSDCKGHYINADELIEDAVDELVSGTYSEVLKFAEAALDDIDACDTEVKDQHKEAAAKNLAVRQMLDTALSVVKVAAAGVAGH